MRLWLGRASMAAVAAAAPAAGPQLSSASSHAGSPGAQWQQRRHRPSELQRRCLVVEVNARDGKQRRKPQPRDGDGSSSGSDEVRCAGVLVAGLVPSLPACLCFVPLAGSSPRTRHVHMPTATRL